MSNIIESSAILERLNRQHRLLALENEDFEQVLEYIRKEFIKIIEGISIGSSREMKQLCQQLNERLENILVRREGANAKKKLVIAGKEISPSIATLLRREINDARQRISQQLQREAGWDKDIFNKIRKEASQRIGRDIGPDPSVLTEEQVLQEHIPESAKIAFKTMVEEWKLDVGLIYQLLSDLYPGLFREPDEDHLGILSEYLGSCTQTTSPLILVDLPPAILTHPDVAWFREILFNAKRDKLLPIYANEGVERVWDDLDQEMTIINAREDNKLINVPDGKEKLAIQQEHALKRQFVNAMAECFLEIEEMKIPSSMRKLIRGRSFPDRQQKTAAYENLRFGGRLFNAGRTGSGKTGAIIYTIALGMDEGTFEKIIIECPACILSEWRLALSDDPEFGYFNEGFLNTNDVIFIDGAPHERPDQWKAAKAAKIIVIGIEMAREKTEDVAHAELLKELNADMYILDEAHRAKNTSKKATVSEDPTDADENGNGLQEYYIEQKRTDMSIMYEVSRCSPYRVFSSATVVTNTIDDLVAPTVCLNSEPEQYKCKAKPQPHRLIQFDKFLSNHALESDKEVLKTILHPKSISRKFEVKWDDIGNLRSDIMSGGRECPRRFLPHYYHPPKEACIPTPEFPSPVIDIFPLSPIEEGVCENIRSDNELSAFDKMRQLIRVSSHCYARSDCAETGKSMFQQTKGWLDKWFQEGIQHAIVVSPLYAKGMTRPTDFHPTECLLEQLKSEYSSQGIIVSSLDGKDSKHKVLKTPSEISGRSLTTTQRLIEEFANTERGIQVVQKDVIGIGINEYARAGISHVIVCGYAWTKAEIDQLFGRFARPGQLAENVCFVILLAEGFGLAMYRQAEMKSTCNEIFLSGRVPTKEQLRLFYEKPSQQPISIQTKTKRERFRDLCHMMAGNGRRFIESSPFADEFVELYNLNWEESFNGNVLRMVGGVAQQRIEHMKQPKSENEPILIADDGAGTFGFHRTMMHTPGLEIHSSDLQPKMVTNALGQAILKENYKPELVHPGWPVDGTGYKDESINMRVTSLVLDCLTHSEKPKKAGREMIRTFLESNRILAQGNSDEVNGEWIITLTTNIFRDDKKRIQKFLATFPYFGFKIITECTGKAKCKQQNPDEDPFEVFVFTAKKFGEPVIEENTPWEDLPLIVREGLNFRFKKPRNAAKKMKKKASAREEKGSYYDDFAIETISGEIHEVEYTADPKREERKEKLRSKRALLRTCTPTLKVILQKYSSIDEIPLEMWLKLKLDDILVSDTEVLETPKQIRDTYMHAIFSLIGSDVLHVIEQVNINQKRGMLIYREEKGGRYLVFGNAQGNPSGDKYYLDKPVNGKNGNGNSIPRT